MESLSYGKEPSCSSLSLQSQAPDQHSTPANPRYKQVFTVIDQSTVFFSAGSQGSLRAPALFAVKEGLSQSKGSIEAVATWEDIENSDWNHTFFLLSPLLFELQELQGHGCSCDKVYHPLLFLLFLHFSH